VRNFLTIFGLSKRTWLHEEIYLVFITKGNINSNVIWYHRVCPGSSIRVVAIVWAGQPTNQCLIPNRDRNFSLWLFLPDWLWDPPSLLSNRLFTL